MKEKVKEKELTWATVNTDDPEEMERFRRQDAKRAGQRIRKAAKELQDLNVIDEEGELIDKELPPDMQPGSKCDLCWSSPRAPSLIEHDPKTADPHRPARPSSKAAGISYSPYVHLPRQPSTLPTHSKGSATPGTPIWPTFPGELVP